MKTRETSVVAPTQVASSHLIANDKDDTLHMIEFICPESEWKDAWAIAESMMKTFLIEGYEHPPEEAVPELEPINDDVQDLTTNINAADCSTAEPPTCETATEEGK
jgi:hypothetical protein